MKNSSFKIIISLSEELIQIDEKFLIAPKITKNFLSNKLSLDQHKTDEEILLVPVPPYGK